MTDKESLEANKARIKGIVARTPESTVRYIRKTVDLADRIAIILKRKGMTQNDLAKALGKADSEISKWLGGQHNFTIRTLTAIEAVLGENILVVPEGKRQDKYYPQEYPTGKLGILISNGEASLKSELNQLNWEITARKSLATKTIAVIDQNEQTASVEEKKTFYCVA
ncbi:MAG: helix-turn-helix transcriptional regulator [Bacteroidota bacterium]